MEIVAVLDIKAGKVVRGIGGQREQYAPVRSRFCDGAEPLSVADAFRRHFRLHRLYVADLDAIAGADPALELFDQLVKAGFCVMAEIGLLTAEDAKPLAGLGVDTIVAGSETLRSPGELTRLVERFGTQRVLCSLDMKDGRLLTAIGEWHPESPERALDTTVTAGTRRVLLLDLAHVGTYRGPGHEALVRYAKERHPHLQVYVGGGVRHAADLDRLDRLGVHGVLIASALHDGRLTVDDLIR
jgi:phosphoribosylformimino-5-aminoimidazole carboxamide ribotide isomerase